MEHAADFDRHQRNNDKDGQAYGQLDGGNTASCS
jgi:hypothetical protein